MKLAAASGPLHAEVEVLALPSATVSTGGQAGRVEHAASGHDAPAPRCRAKQSRGAHERLAAPLPQKRDRHDGECDLQDQLEVREIATRALRDGRPPVRALGRFMLALLPSSAAAEVDPGICRPTGSRIVQLPARTGRLRRGRAGAQFNLWARPRQMRFDQDQEGQLLAYTRADASTVGSWWSGMYNTTALHRCRTSRGAAPVGSRRQLAAGTARRPSRLPSLVPLASCP